MAARAAAVIAVRVADLACPARQGLGKDGPDGADSGWGGPDPVREMAVAEAGGGGACGGAPRRGGFRPPGTRLIMPGWGWPRSGWMSCAGYRA